MFSLISSQSADYRGAVAAAQAFVTAARKNDGTSLKNWMEQSETQLSEFLEVLYCTASDGVPFTCKVSDRQPVQTNFDQSNFETIFDFRLRSDFEIFDGCSALGVIEIEIPVSLTIC